MERKREKAIYDDARQVLCVMCKNPTTFKATLSLKKGYAPVMRRVRKPCHTERVRERGEDVAGRRMRFPI